MIKNTKYSILNAENKFVNFKGISRLKKNKIYDIHLYNGLSIKCSKDHLFIVNNQNLSASDITPDITYLSTISGDSFVKSINEIDNTDYLYDIIEADSGYTYITNGIYSHNCSFLGSGDNFVAEEYIKFIEENTIETPIREDYTDKKMWIWEEPSELGEYLMGIDVSSGHGDDYSTINIFEINQITEERIIYKSGKKKKQKVTIHKATQVAEYYGKLSPQELGEVAYTFGTRYNNAYTVVDVTGGWGSQTVVKLFELGYETQRVHHSEISHKPTRDKLNGYIQQSTKKLPDGSESKVDLVPGFWIGGNRGVVLTEMERVIRMEEVIIKSNRLLQELKTFVTVTGSRVADHKRSFHDDSIMGMAISLYVANFEKLKYNVSPSKTKKMLDALINLNNNNSNTKQKDGSYKTQRENPFGQHSWLMKGINKR